MDFTEFVQAHRKDRFKPDSEISERWAARVVPLALPEQGVAGAAQYLSRWGKLIGCDKVVRFAQAAEFYAAPELAIGFWIEAHKLKYGTLPTNVPRTDQPRETPSVSLTPRRLPVGTPAAETWLDLPMGTPAAPPPPTWSEFPPDLRPGRTLTMQPMDAEFDRDFYVQAADFAGQAKCDGVRQLVYATPTWVAYQPRQEALGVEPHPLAASPSPELDAALMELAAVEGPFILDCERLWRSASGKEHRSGSQAVEANRRAAQPLTQVWEVLAVFDALFVNVSDLRYTSFAGRWRAAERLANALRRSPAGRFIELVRTAFTTTEKAALVADQQANGREGEVWRHVGALYDSQRRTPNVVRTKYISVHLAQVTGWLPSKAKKDLGRRIASLILVHPVTGEPLGNVGASSRSATQAELEVALASGRPFYVRVATQGFTETGKFFLPRLQPANPADPEGTVLVEYAPA